MNKSTRKELEKQFKKNIILSAAKELFKEKGYSKTKISEIAKSAGFAKGTFYLYFNGKNSVMEEILIDEFQNIYKEFEAIISLDLSPEKKLVKFFDLHHHIITKGYKKYDFSNYFENDKEFIMFLNSENNEQLEIHFDNYIKIFEQVIKEGIEKKIFRNDIDILKLSLLLKVHLSAELFNCETYERIQKKYGITSEELYENEIKILLHGLIKHEQ